MDDVDSTLIPPEFPMSTTVPMILPESTRWYMIVNMVCVMMVGTIGNVFTLIALPYGRIR